MFSSALGEHAKSWGISALEAEAATLTGKDNKKERAAKGKEVAELKAEQYHDCMTQEDIHQDDNEGRREWEFM